MAQMIVGQSGRFAGIGGRFAGIGGRYHAAAGGFVVILVLATGLAVGFRVVMERLITPGAASVSATAARETRAFTSIAHVVDRWYDEPAAAATGTRRVADRRDDGATGGSLHAIITTFGDGGIQSSVQLEETAPNELRLIAR